jgi:alkylated DNA repair dioxygenase AlkB
LLSKTERRYDLTKGEVMVATGTNQQDLRELWGYGWSPDEAARNIEDTLDLR